MFRCSLQINLAPNDYRHAKYMLPKQIDALIDQVDEVVLILDTHRSKGRFGIDWDENLLNIRQIIEIQLRRSDKIRTYDVDYSPAALKEIARFFFGKNVMPKKDFRGGPFYSYFYGLYQSEFDYVLHLDSDIFLGGLSQTWVREAIEMLASDKNIFTTSPLPGPPHPLGILVNQPSAQKLLPDYQFKFSAMSTRIFMIDKRVFQKNKLKLSYPGVVNSLKALLRKHSLYDLPEHIISRYMIINRLHRVDFLGTGNGMWSIHPPYKSELFINMIPGLLENIAKNNLHPAQNGNYDIAYEICDWTPDDQKLEDNRWWKKIIYAKTNK